MSIWSTILFLNLPMGKHSQQNVRYEPTIPALQMEEAPGEQSCSKWEAASKDEVCAKPCKLSCDDAVARQVRLERASTGYELDPGDRQKALRGCAAACENECESLIVVSDRWNE